MRKSKAAGGISIRQTAQENWDGHVKEELIKSARADCEEILRQNAARFCRNNCVYFKKSQQNYGAKFPQDAADAFNQCFLKNKRKKV